MVNMYQPGVKHMTRKSRKDAPALSNQIASSHHMPGLGGKARVEHYLDYLQLEGSYRPPQPNWRNAYISRWTSIAEEIIDNLHTTLSANPELYDLIIEKVISVHEPRNFRCALIEVLAKAKNPEFHALLRHLFRHTEDEIIRCSIAHFMRCHKIHPDMIWYTFEMLYSAHFFYSGVEGEEGFRSLVGINRYRGIHPDFLDYLQHDQAFRTLFVDALVRVVSYGPYPVKGRVLYTVKRMLRASEFKKQREIPLLYLYEGELRTRFTNMLMSCFNNDNNERTRVAGDAFSGKDYDSPAELACSCLWQINTAKTRQAVIDWVNDDDNNGEYKSWLLDSLVYWEAKLSTLP